MLISRDTKSETQNGEKELGYIFGIHRLWMGIEAKGVDMIIQRENVK